MIMGKTGMWLALSASASLALVLLAPPVGAEIRDVTILMPPTDEFVHFTDGYLIAPGFIDLGNLTFTAVSDSIGGFTAAADDAVYNEPFDDDTIPDDDKVGGTDDGFGDTGGAFYGRTDDGDGTPPRRTRSRSRNLSRNRNRRQQKRQLAEQSQESDVQSQEHQRQLEGGVEEGSSVVDIAVFNLPDSCANTRSGCDWTDLGIGAKTANKTTRWCCSGDAVENGLCAGGDDYGRLIIQNDLFNGNHRFVEISQTGASKKSIRYGKMEEHVTGQYVVLFANCNPKEGREVAVTGETIWRSKHGFLPGELFEFMYFYLFLVVVYFALLLWYGISMKVNEESRIPIEKWILMTIVLGLGEMFFRTSDYMIWNQDGYRQDLAMYMGIFMGAVKRGISRCLIVMVALGWGVVRDSLGSAMRMIVVLGAVYVGVSAAQSLMLIFAVEDMKTLSFEEEEELFDVVTVLTFVTAALDVIFIMWILDALNGTMEYLENMNQSRKLMRYLRLRCIFLFSILFAVVWAVFSLVDTYDEEGIVREEQEWVIDAATELNYLFVLVAVAVLWRPNPSAKEYAYVMELPAMGGEGDDENELELTGYVPSALDDEDGEEPSSGAGTNGYHDENEFNDDRFQIDDAEAT
jgi:hypothetical protein